MSNDVEVGHSVPRARFEYEDATAFSACVPSVDPATCVESWPHEIEVLARSEANGQVDDRLRKQATN